jgi:hypothetical protein
VRTALDPISFQQEKSQQLLRTPKPIDVVQVQTTATTIYTADSSADFHIQLLVAANVSGVDTTITVYLVPSGGSASAANMIVHQRKMPPYSTSRIFAPDSIGMLQPGMILKALCAVNNDVNMHGWGYDYFGVYP